MCTLTLAWRVFPDAPVLVAANRDEATDRPSSPPAVRDGDPRVLAPRDERAGGTWLGVNERGLLVGITNRWTDASLAGDRSRGRLVADALAASDASDAAAVVRRAVADTAYEGFNLLVADADDAVLFEWDGELAETHLDPGVHVVVNVGADDDFDLPAYRTDAAEAQAANARHARAELAVRDDETPGEWLARAKRVLGDHDYGLCVHGDGYGTRSSSLVAVRADGDVEYDYADGPPCRTPFERVAHDL